MSVESAPTAVEPVPTGVPVTINGKEILAAKGELVIDAAERHGIFIPRFCHHPRMKSVGMCRMCIVEIDTGRGPSLQPSCMIECAPGMVVDTQSPVTIKAQDGVLEFLLINHPLDCPVCDKGGECPLQDQTVAYGPGESRFVEEKRHKEKPIPISDLVLLDRERCILCDRCTRFAKDVAGDPLIHFFNRGNQTEVNAFPDHPFASYFSGNVVQICPVGALTASGYRFRARPWDLEQTESTCQTCSVGCRIDIDSSRNEVLRYQGVDIDPVNWGWLCDKGRFGFEAVQSENRLTDPLVRTGRDSAFQVARWADALRQVSAALQGALDRGGPQSIGVIGGSRLTNEDAYAWTKLAKGVLGTDNVDCQLGDGLPPALVLGVPKASIDDVCRAGGTVLWLAPDPKEELPVLFLRLRQAVIDGGVTLIEVAPTRSSITDLSALFLQHRPGEVHEAVRAMLAGIPQGRDGGGVDPTVLGRARAALDTARAAGNLTVVVGRTSVAESTDWIADATGALIEAVPGVRILTATRRANVHGALDMGMAPGLLPGRTTLEEARELYAQAWPTVPADNGLDTAAMLRGAVAGDIDTIVLLGADPIGDFPDRALAEQALASVRNLIAVDTFLNESVQRADIVLAAAGFAEVEGTTTNIEGRVSVLNQKVTPPGTSRTDWMIAAELAFRLGSDLQLESADDIWDEVERLAPSHAGLTLDLLFSGDAADGVVVPLPAAGGGTGGEGDGGEAPSDESPADEGSPGESPSDEGQADAGSADESPADESPADEAPQVGARPAMIVFAGPEPLDPPALDAYSLRLVASRKLYDTGTLVQASPSLAALAPGTVLRINPYDFERLGVTSGQQLHVKSAKGGVTIEVLTDEGVLRGTATVQVNQPNVLVGSLIDAEQRVTDIRIESGGAQ